jgi:hypothetical protein
VVKLDDQVEWIIFFTDRAQATEVLGPDWATALTQVSVKYTPIQHYTLEEQLKLPRIFNSSQLDLLHVPHFNVPLAYQGKLIVTIHDLLWH